MQIMKIENMCKQYNHVDVLKNINISINKGEFISIVGKSGSGKSTLLYTMGGLEEPTSGKVMINNLDFNQLNDEDKSKIRNKELGFIFQFYNLVENLTVEENILLPSLMSGKRKSELVPKLKKILELIDLSEKNKNVPSELSGGQQQRVAIARAVINDPQIVLADEPTGNLDSKTGTSVMNLLKTINKELQTTVIHVTHNPEWVNWGNRVITLFDGKVYSDQKVQGNSYEKD